MEIWTPTIHDVPEGHVHDVAIYCKNDNNSLGSNEDNEILLVEPDIREISDLENLNALTEKIKGFFQQKELGDRYVRQLEKTVEKGNVKLYQYFGAT